MKKILAFALAVVLLLGVCAFTAVAEDADVHKITMLIPECDPAARPFQVGDLQAGVTTCPAWEAFLELEAKYGIQIVFEPIMNSQYDTVGQTRLAAGLDLPDIMSIKFLGDSEITQYAHAGTFLPVSDIIEEYCSDETKDRIAAYYPYVLGLSADPVDGKSYFYAAAYTNTFDGVPSNYIIDDKLRYDWLQKLDLDAPTTPWELADVLVAFAENDANGNGVYGDEKFYVVADSFYSLGNYFGLGMDLLWSELLDQDGNYSIESPWLQESTADYFTLMNQLYNAGVLEIGNGYDQLNAEDALAGFHAYAWQHSVEDTAPNSECFYIDLPYDMVGTDGVEPIARMDPFNNFPNENFKFAVLNTCEDLEGVGKLFDMLFSEEYEVLTIAGIEGVTYDVIPGNGDRAQEAINIAFKVSDGDVTAMRETGLCKGYRIWGKGILPRITAANTTSSYLKEQIQANQEAGDWKQAMRLQAQLDGYDHGTITVSTKKLAMPTDEESERIAILTTDLETYAAELWRNLVTGVVPVEDLDSCIEKLQAMGLDELLALEEELCERMVDAMN